MAGPDRKYSSLTPDPVFVLQISFGFTSGLNSTKGLGLGVLSLSKKPVQPTMKLANKNKQGVNKIFLILYIVVTQL